ncbi:transposase family protein [Streptomyces sp. NPDC059917]|uniref:transposase family protein n=1 Tax=Streptomyces sp. NPDC059917 TaxID=3347002 RepID=UPI00365EB04E
MGHSGHKEPSGLLDHGWSLGNRSRNPTGSSAYDTEINTAATRLLGLEGVSVVQGDDYGRGSLVNMVASEDSARACRGCGVFSTRLRDYRTTRPRHLPWGVRAVNVHWRKSRWCCTEPACPHNLACP